VGFFLVAAHVFLSLTGLEVGKGFGFWLDQVETLRSQERGWYLGAVRTQLVTREKSVSIYNHLAFEYDSGSSAYNAEQAISFILKPNNQKGCYISLHQQIRELILSYAPIL
jgi:hypothetical protein